ncbi:MAG: TIGR02452 family protein [Acidobacteriota bacterium]
MSLKGIAKETLAIVEAGAYVAPSGERRDLRAAIDQSIAGTRLYDPADLETLLAARPDAVAVTAPPRIEVTGETTGAAARRIATSGSVAALNFASAKNPGGGFLGGAKAQEEDLARCSALYSCQITVPRYYAKNRACGSPLYTDHVIYSPSVPFFRDERLELLEEPFACSIVTAPAPNAGVALRGSPRARPGVTAALARRAAMVLAVFADRGERRLVLGAWGCGVFRNDPVEVATVFATLLASPAYACAFDLAVFAIYDRRPDQPVLAAFQRAFADNGGAKMPISTPPDL